MAYSLNSAQLIGNLGRDPEFRTTQNGGEVCNISLATSDGYKDRSGNWVDTTMWHRVVIWNEFANKIAKTLRKGSKVYVQGKIKTRKWTDQSGAEKYTTEIVIENYGGEIIPLDPKERREDQSQQDFTANDYREQSSGGGQAPVDMDDEIPFSPLRELP